MSTDRAASPAVMDGDSTMRFFTVESAERSLPLVRRIAADIVADYAELMKLRDARHAQSDPASDLEADRLRGRLERQAERLNYLQQELAEIGCELKDWSLALIDFPAIHEGRRVWLCWKLGEDRISHWHEWGEGFASRQPIGPQFEPARVDD